MTKQQNLLYKVRDMRAKEKFYMDDEYLNGYARLVGVTATAVYMSLCRHASKDQECFPAETLIAKQHNINVRTVQRAIRVLKKANIINVTREKKSDGKWLNNTYVLLDRSGWIKPDDTHDVWSATRQKEQKPDDTGVVLREHIEKDTHILADKKLSAHAQFIHFFHDTAMRSRGVKPIITGKDGQNLKRVLTLGIVTPTELQQLALYFLAHWQYKKFAPSVSTFLSSGILNGLMDALKNDQEFWKTMDGFKVGYSYQPVKTDGWHSLGDRLAQLRAKLSM